MEIEEEKDSIQEATENMDNKEIYKNEEDENKRNILRILYTKNIDYIMRHYRYVALSKVIEMQEVEIADEVTEKICDDFFENYFLDDKEMQEVLKQLPVSYRHEIFKNLK